MERQELIERLTPIAQRVFEKETLVLTDDLSPLTLNTWTSLSFTQFLQAVESEFQFKFTLMELLRFKTMGAIIDSTMKHLANA